MPYSNEVLAGRGLFKAFLCVWNYNFDNKKYEDSEGKRLQFERRKYIFEEFGEELTVTQKIQEDLVKSVRKKFNRVYTIYKKRTRLLKNKKNTQKYRQITHDDLQTYVSKYEQVYTVSADYFANPGKLSYKDIDSLISNTLVTRCGKLIHQSVKLTKLVYFKRFIFDILRHRVNDFKSIMLAYRRVRLGKRMYDKFTSITGYAKAFKNLYAKPVKKALSAKNSDPIDLEKRYVSQFRKHLTALDQTFDYKEIRLAVKNSKLFST